jgi:general secretion pathway protein A
MYESYYGFSEKPFSLTPDPKFLYRSESHGNAFDLLQYAIRRREGFVVITGDIGTGKTTLCRALLEQIDRTTFTALVLNPFLSEEELLKRILQDFGVVSREEAKAPQRAGVTKQELVDVLYEFLLGLVPLNANAVLIIDEAQNLPPPVLEQIRILSNLETDKEKLLQIILVGQLDLQEQLRSPELRQLDQRVSIRYELKPLDADAVAAYVAHRLAIAGGSASVSFTTKALERVHKLSHGIPRLINLICDRALLAGFSARTNRITPEMVTEAAETLDVQSPGPPRKPSARRPLSISASAAVVLLASAFAVGASSVLYQKFVGSASQSQGRATNPPGARVAPAPVRAADPPSVPSEPVPVRAAGNPDRRLPDDAELTILVGSSPLSGPEGSSGPGPSDSIASSLERLGYRVYYAEVDLGAKGRWRRVLVGAYTDLEAARADAARLKGMPVAAQASVVTRASAVATPNATEPPRSSPRPRTGP